jgi:hypothetical protein
MLLKTFAPAFLTLLAIGCGSTTPTAPAPTPTPTPAPPPTTYAVSGTLTATNGGQPLSGVTTSLGPVIGLTTNDAGVFSATLNQTGNYSLILTAPSILIRRLTVGVQGPRAIAVDAIALGGSFDLKFYREMIRNGYEAPNTLQPLRRWMVTPRIYLKTVDEVGEAIHGPTLNVIEATIKDAVPRWTGGALGVPIVERGTASREGVSGWITVKFPASNTILEGYCGRALVGVDGGWIEFGYHDPPTNGFGCRTATSVVAATTVRHEVGHSLGFWHTDAPSDLMWGGAWNETNQLPSPRELAAAAIAYRRPVGNVDPDTDPSGTVNLAPMSVR